jgi:hypothetical protein
MRPSRSRPRPRPRRRRRPRDGSRSMPNSDCRRGGRSSSAAGSSTSSTNRGAGGVIGNSAEGWNISSSTFRSALGASGSFSPRISEANERFGLAGSSRARGGGEAAGFAGGAGAGLGLAAAAGGGEATGSGAASAGPPDKPRALAIEAQRLFGLAATGAAAGVGAATGSAGASDCRSATGASSGAGSSAGGSGGGGAFEEARPNRSASLDQRSLGSGAMNVQNFLETVNCGPRGGEPGASATGQERGVRPTGTTSQAGRATLCHRRARHQAMHALGVNIPGRERGRK